MSIKRYENNIILVYGCCHFPFHDKRVFDFLNDINNNYKPDRIIDLGDTADQYNFSRYPKSPSAISTSQELKKLRACIKTLGSIFPRVDIMQSNHCDRLYSKATVSGIPRELIIPYKKLLDAPEQWKWHKDLTLTIDSTREKVFFCHEKGANAFNLAKTIAMNVVMGHHHNSMGIQYFANPLKDMFAVQCPSLISDKGPPFSYNKANLFRPMKGAVIIQGGIPELIKLN